MMVLLNLLVSVGLAPAVLAGVAQVTTKDRTLVILSAVLSALSGLVCVWDAAIRPGPKLGADWRFPTPKNFMLVNLGVYGLVIPFVVVVGFWVQSQWPAVRELKILNWLWLVILIGTCLWVPQSKQGPDSGVPLSTD